MISSKDNPKFRLLQDLAERKHRDSSGLMIVEGAQEIALALKHDHEIHGSFLCPDRIKTGADRDLAGLLNARHPKPLEFDEKLFSKLSYMATSSALLVVKQPKRSLSSLNVNDRSFVLVVVGIEKPGNLGALVRTADAVSACAVIVADPHIDPWNPNALRGSRGSILTLPLVETSSLETLRWLRQKSFHIYTADAQQGQNLFEAQFKQPCALVLGAEKHGLPEVWKQAGLSPLKIPMREGLDSLNVSVAAGVLMYRMTNAGP